MPYLTGALFLTNVFYLPMLALRSPRDDAPTAPPPLTAVQRLGESRGLAALVGIAVPLLALGWFAFGRADVVVSVGLEARWADIVALVSSDRLAFSFCTA